jgi:glycosyltransferase involved in cell wall biosynthesis
MPRISVIIPTYQSVQFIQGAIDSVLQQTYRDYEVIVVDGGSTDGTLVVLNSYGNRIRVIRQNGRGISNALNNGIAASNGEYIAFMGSDDLWVPNKLEVQCKFLQSRSDRVGLVYSNVLFFEDRNGKLRTSRMKEFYRGKVIKHLLEKNFIPASTVMIRKSCLEKVGYFDESLEVCEDIDMWIRVAASFEIDYQDLALAEIRWHSGSVLHSDLERHFRSIIALQNKIMPYLLKDAKPKSFHKAYYRPYLTFGVRYLLKNDFKNAKQKLGQYIKSYPYDIKAYFLLLLTSIPFDLSSRLMQEQHIAKSLGVLQTKLSR